MAAQKAGPVEAGVERDIAALGSEELATSGLAASALALAGLIDDPKNSATSKAQCQKALLDTLDRLRELAPPKVERDRVDEIAKRREQRLRKRAAG